MFRTKSLNPSYASKKLAAIGLSAGQTSTAGRYHDDDNPDGANSVTADETLAVDTSTMIYCEGMSTMVVSVLLQGDTTGCDIKFAVGQPIPEAEDGSERVKIIEKEDLEEAIVADFVGIPYSIKGLQWVQVFVDNIADGGDPKVGVIVSLAP